MSQIVLLVNHLSIKLEVGAPQQTEQMQLKIP